MIAEWPKVKARRSTQLSPWTAITEREVEFAPGAQPELYHAVGQQDHIAIVATLPDGRIPIVRQYRPALKSFTGELPAGLVDPGEDAALCCRRELMEETGFAVRALHVLGTYAPCARGCRTGCIRFTSRSTRSPRANQQSRESNSNW